MSSGALFATSCLLPAYFLSDYHGWQEVGLASPASVDLAGLCACLTSKLTGSLMEVAA